MNHAWWAQIVLEQALQSPSVPTDVWITPGDSVIQVNKYGKRVANEKMVYNERTQVHFEWDPVPGEYKNLLLCMVYDQRTADGFGGRLGYPIPAPGTSAPYVLSGQTLGELASAIDARLAGLAGRTGGFRLAESFGTNRTASALLRVKGTGLGEAPWARRSPSAISRDSWRPASRSKAGRSGSIARGGRCTGGLQGDSVVLGAAE